MRLLCIFACCLAWLIAFAPIVRPQDANGNGIVDRFELPGTQPNSSLPAADTEYNIDEEIDAATTCSACHNNASNLAWPVQAWSGSMMANAARDPVFWAQLDVAEADEASDPTALAGARDLCLRCHIGKGWAEGRSSAAPQEDAFRGMLMEEDDLFGVQCEICHRMVEPILATADAVDRIMLDGGTGTGGLNSNPDTLLRIPATYGLAMYVLDRADVRRGPYTEAQIGWPDLVTPTNQFISTAADWPPAAGVITHPTKHSEFHRKSELCGTCHDVSNPGWPPEPGAPLSAKDDVPQNYPIERTFTEWKHSGYPAMGEDGSCQSCHMSGPMNGVAYGAVSSQGDSGAIHVNDVHVHDFTGGNVWIPRVIETMVSEFQATKGASPPGPVDIGTTQEDKDLFLDTYYATVLRELFPAGTFAETSFLENVPLLYSDAAYQEASDRARATLERAAELSGEVSGSDLNVRVWNMTGHKLPTGYPEGRRMWIGIQFRDVDPTTGDETFVAESGRYDESTGELFHDFNIDDAAGPRTYDIVTYTDQTGTVQATGRRTQVYEARAHHQASGAEFHFILNNERERDNRIPPIGWNKSNYELDFADQVFAYPGSQMEYHDAATGPPAGVVEDTYNFDEVPYPIPATSDIADVTLWYQSVSLEYIEELVAASPRTLTYPAGAGANGFTRADLLEHAWRTFSIAGQTRMPPIEMETLRVALVDTDGDGLSDDWESAYGLDPSSSAGDDGRHGDIDGDGRSNYIEFQQGSQPDSADSTREPLDLALVLDFSGSMSATAPAGSQAKSEVLIDAVELFLDTWEPYAVLDDRIAIVYFASGVTAEGGGLVDFSTLSAGTTIGDELDDLVTAVRTHAVDGSTAMGGGLQTGLNLIQAGSGRRKHVILFTNGMQNYSPMVREVTADPGDYHIVAEAISSADGVYGDSGVTDTGGPTFGTKLEDIGATIHTIGIGVAETSDDRWVSLIKGIADDSGGAHQFVSRAFELEGAFLHDLVELLRGFSPQLAGQFAGTLHASAAESLLEFEVDAAAEKATFALSWAGDTESDDRLQFEIRTPDGRVANELGRTEDGARHGLETFYFPLALSNGRPVEHAGTWTMIVRHGDGKKVDDREDRDRPRADTDFRAYLVTDVPRMDFRANFSKPSFQVGEELVIQAAVLDDHLPIRSLSRVEAEIVRPSEGFGTFLSQARVSEDALFQLGGLAGDQLSDRAEAKAQLALSDAKLASAIAPLRETVTLHDDGTHGDGSAGDGVFTGQLGTAEVPGLVSATIDVSGVSARSGVFRRRFRADTMVGHGAFSLETSFPRAFSIPATDTTPRAVRINVSPKDDRFNYLGPGHRDRVEIDVPSLGSASLIVDDLDGSYSRTFEVPGGGETAPARISVDGDLLFEGPISELIEDATDPEPSIGPWLVLLLVLLILILLLALVWVVRGRG